ncbi:hypothetical protein [Microbacterium terricola]|uniref:PA14 domain-containing protein n=1 Tax=Microbacterium terricola TaxID=344163 RepID=A0ABM8DWM0_9MICO|nr:hypothetical protein [Microbacterium terricola]UYK39268.1 hypothetical protein OAU46_11235 [Microbacterium terricola]BDV30011.1 hypothetical protein Microterr_06710 [Microbacterium terricola]
MPERGGDVRHRILALACAGALLAALASCAPSPTGGDVSRQRWLARAQAAYDDANDLLGVASGRTTPLTHETDLVPNAELVRIDSVEVQCFGGGIAAFGYGSPGDEDTREMRPVTCDGSPADLVFGPTHVHGPLTLTIERHGRPVAYVAGVRGGVVPPDTWVDHFSGAETSPDSVSSMWGSFGPPGLVWGAYVSAVVPGEGEYVVEVTCAGAPTVWVTLADGSSITVEEGGGERQSCDEVGRYPIHASGDLSVMLDPHGEEGAYLVEVLPAR